MDQKTALNIMKSGYNIFLTGPPGSGKTFILNKYIDYLKNESIKPAITATTGIAATHLNGLTIHSWSGIGIKEKLNEENLKYLKSKFYLKKRITNNQILIIDEISMLNANQLEMIDRVVRMFKKSIRPMGGMQVILCGDFFQLPPVGASNQNNQFVFNSKTWKDLDLKICYLNEQHRQKNDKLYEILNKIRKNQIDSDIINEFLYLQNTIKSKELLPTKLYTHNFDVEKINSEFLEKISEDPVYYTMYNKGSQKLVEILKRGCLAQEVLTLKKGAIVMFVKNDFENNYVNGTLGKIIDFSEHKFPIVETLNKDRITAYPKTWELDEDKNNKALIEQIPLRLAWAVTVHKSQGMTLDCATIDLSRSFEYGMGYVALSRIKSLKGISLLGFNQKALEVNPYILQNDLKLKQQSKKIYDEFKKMSKSKIKKMKKEFFSEIL